MLVTYALKVWEHVAKMLNISNKTWNIISRGMSLQEINTNYNI